MKRLKTPLAALAVVTLSVPVHGQVRFETKAHGVLVEVNGKPFTALHFGNRTGKPYLHPLLTISGGPDPVTRAFPVDPLPGDSTDHPNHRGLAVGAEMVNGEDFWDNEPESRGPGRGKGTIEFQEILDASGGDERGTLAILTHWIDSTGKRLITERRRMIFHAKPTTQRTLDIDIELEANEPITFADHQSAIIGLRLALPFDTHYDGWVANASGATNEAGVRGRRSPWLVWTGITSGGQRMGVALLDHPANLNHPTRWQVRDKGYLMANPFGGRIFQQFDPSAAGENAEYTMKPGDKLRLRYRLLIYASEKEVPQTVGKVGDLFKEFAR
jgi:hypothetical protein